jgi:hypothetical protein
VKFEIKKSHEMISYILAWIAFWMLHRWSFICYIGDVFVCHIGDVSYVAWVTFHMLPKWCFIYSQRMFHMFIPCVCSMTMLG